jgi:hypothetical protein
MTPTRHGRTVGSVRFHSPRRFTFWRDDSLKNWPDPPSAEVWTAALFFEPHPFLQSSNESVGRKDASSRALIASSGPRKPIFTILNQRTSRIADQDSRGLRRERAKDRFRRRGGRPDEPFDGPPWHGDIWAKPAATRYPGARVPSNGSPAARGPGPVSIGQLEPAFRVGVPDGANIRNPSGAL